MRAPTRIARAIAAITLFTCAVAGTTGGTPTALAAGYPTIDGKYSGTGVIGPGATITLDVTGRGSVPAGGVGAVAINLTVTNSSDATFLTVFPTGASRPTASNVNVTPGQTVPNMVISRVGTNGTISIYNRFGYADVIVDVLGWFPTGSDLTATTPARVLDTRSGRPTIDGRFSGVGALGVNGRLDLTIGGRATVPAGAEAVAVNVTVTGPTAPTFLTMWPAGASRPTASNVNAVAAQTVSNMAFVRLGSGDAVSLFNRAGSAHVVVDVLGWFPNGATFTGVTPARLMDTRSGLPTIDNRYRGAGALGAGTTTTLDVTGRGGVPANGVGAVVLNVAVTQPTAGSFATVWPTGRARPTASNLNYRAGQTVSNMVIAGVGSNGLVSIYNRAGSAHLVVDVLGYLPASGDYRVITPERFMDTRVIADPNDPNDPSLDPFVCRTYTHAVAGNVSNAALTEISGMARGRRDRSVLWVHEDSGAKADVIALSLAGQERQTFRLTGATARDWEDMDVGPGPTPGVNYLYMGDIGDNGKNRDNITVWRMPEPAVSGGGLTPVAGAQGIVARYPDGPHNAEAMAVGADGTIYVITKATTTGVYAIPFPQSTTGVTTMTKIDAGTLAPLIDRSGADIRPDGRALIVRGYRGAQTWPIIPGESMATTLSREPCDTPTFRNEKQGEAIAFLGNDGSYTSVGEQANTPVRQYTL